MASNLVQVPFHGDIIEATRDERGVWVPLRRPCESLGLDHSSQSKKLKGKPWACMVIITIQDTGGRQQQAACLHLDSLPMWLATIEASRVKESIRSKLELYQREAAKVLADHFFGRRQTEAVGPDLLAAMTQLVTAVASLAARVERMEQKPQVIPSLGGMESGQFIGVQERVGELWPGATRKSKQTILDRIKVRCLRETICCVRPIKSGPYVIDRTWRSLVDEVANDVRAEFVAASVKIADCGNSPYLPFEQQG